MPQLFTHTTPRLGVWKMEETSEQLLQKLQRPELYQARLATLSIEKRRREWLSCILLLRDLTGQECPVAYRSNGAPYLPGRPVSVSFSHTGRYAAVLVSDEPAVGIDIETRSARIRKVQDYFLAPAEKAFIDREAEDDHLSICWCAKETMYKCLGQQGVDFAGHLHLRPFPYASSGYIDVYETRTEARLSFSLAYRVYPEFVLVWSGGLLPAENRS